MPILVRSRAEFVRYVFMPMAARARTLIVGFNLPFDLARLAIDWSDTRRPKRPPMGPGSRPRVPWDAFQGGLSLVLAEQDDGGEDRFKPRIAIKTIDSKRHLIQFRGGVTDDEVTGSDPEGRVFRGHFLDLRTLTFAMTNESHSLKTACETFATEHGKDDHAPTGLVTADEITYGRHDVRATYELAEKLLEEYAQHPISPDYAGGPDPAIALQATRAYSPASIGKAYPRAMGIAPPLDHSAFSRELNGVAMTAFYGGRTECRIRRVPLPVRYVDFTSMYPTVNGLMGLWDLLTAQRVDIVDATDDVRALLASVTVGRVFEPTFWRELAVFVEVEPAGDILPTRGAYDGKAHGWQIGVNPLTADRPLWYALPDVVAATLLGGKAPRVIQAKRVVSSGQAAWHRPVVLRGEVEVDPRTDDFFRVVIEQRNALPDRDGADKPMSDFLKVVANASSYGIFAEMVRHELPKGERLEVSVTGLGDPYRWSVATPEEPGAFAYPPLAALITSAARLMLALLERAVTDAGGSYVMVDTDSMAIVATRRGGLVACPGGDRTLPDGMPAVMSLSWRKVDGVRARFNRLNPYHEGSVRDILKLEDHNFALSPTKEHPQRVDRARPVQLHVYAISSKRYALFNIDATGDPVIRKPSEHGLGHLLNPTDMDDRQQRAWISIVWANLVREALGRHVVPLGFEDRPAVSQIAASSAAMLHPFDRFNAGKAGPDEQVRPFNFLLSANVAPFGHPPGVDPARFHLVTRYERNPSRWLRMRWLDRYSPTGRTYTVTTGPSSGDAVRLKSIGEVIAEYRVHPEAKSLGPDGRPCGRQTIGLLRRRPIRAAHFVYIGKEANELDDVEAGLVHDIGDVVTEYGPVDDTWVEETLPLLRSAPRAELARRSGLSLRTIQRTMAERTRPHPRHRRMLVEALSAWQKDVGRPDDR